MAAGRRAGAWVAGILLAVAAMAPIGGTVARELRVGTQGDLRSMDPTALLETFTLAMQGAVYEGLVRIDADLQLEPALATAWSQPAPAVWRFELRRGVRFHDGTPLTADDVVFSVTRAGAAGSDLRAMVSAVERVEAIGDDAVEITLREPDPIFPRTIPFMYVMSRRWAEANGAVAPSDVRQGRESPAALRANGTGPFLLEARLPGSRTVFARNPAWWDRAVHELDRVTVLPIPSDATRVAALLSGEVDLIDPVPPQDIERLRRSPGVRVVERPELRTIFLGMDQARAELLDSDVTGRNPFQDRRVREAFLLAIDVEAIRTQVMRGAARPSALLVGPGIAGYDPTLDRRPPPDPAAARRLLAEAGFPAGFAVGLDCPTDRYVNDERICQAIAAMLARIGVTVRLHAQPRGPFFRKVLARETSFYLLGWTPSSYDALNVLTNLAATGAQNNLGGFSSPALDALLVAARTEMDGQRRLALLGEAQRIHRDAIGHIPLHQQALAWGVRDGVQVTPRADNVVVFPWIRIDR